MIKIDSPYQTVTKEIPIYSFRKFRSLLELECVNNNLEPIDGRRFCQAYSNCQTTNQWTDKQQHHFIGCLLQKKYMPPIVVRELHKKAKNKTPLWEVLDGWQRITTLQEFFSSVTFFFHNEVLQIPELAQFAPVLCDDEILHGYSFSSLPKEYKEYIKKITVTVHLVTGIETNTTKNKKYADQIYQTLHYRETSN
jgi:hypothetical protein